MPRLFIAIDFPDEVKRRLAALRTDVLPARWVNPEKLHLTLRFIGEIDEPVAQQVEAGLRRVEAPRFLLTLKGMGHFRRQILWVGVESAQPLSSLRTQIDETLQALGLAREEGPYVPHVKLARLKWHGGTRFRALLDEHATFCIEPFEVEQFSLMESCLSPQGAAYRHRVDYALRPVGTCQ